jgi:hypothetical protein
MMRARGLLLGGASFAMLVGANSAAWPVSAAPLDVSAVVSNVVPAAGVAAGGTSIDIEGTGFTDASDVVIGGTVVTATCPSAGGCFTFNSDTDITAVTPPGAPGTSDVTVDNPTFAGTPNPPSDNFTYQQAAPTVTSVSADSGPEAGGAPAITIGGSNFTGSGFTTTGVSFGGTAASFSITNSSSISATPPAGTGLVDITVTTSSTDGTSVATSATSAADTYVYAPVPSVTNVVPSSGPTGGHNAVVLTGTGFESNNAPSASYSATDVVVDTTDIATSPCPGTPTGPCFTVTSPTKITVGYMPPHAAAAVDITVETSGGLSATSSGDQYTYQQLPAVTGVSPTAGPLGGGNNIDVSGSDFTGATDVFLGSIDISPCTGTFPCFVVNSSVSITLQQVPPHAAGTVDIKVQTPAGTSPITSADQYTYQPPAPTVTGVTPTAGPAAGGTSVTVTGAGFEGSGYAASDVFVGSVDISTQCPAAVCFTIDSATSITIPSMPAHAVGAVDITVETIGGVSATSPSDQYTYQPAPVVASVVPPAGALVGGNTVSINGSGFTGATDVTVGTTDISATPCPGTPASACFTVTSDTKITVEDFPPHSGATVDITVTTPFGQSHTSSADTYAYAPVPTVTSLSPHASAPTGGISVNVTGSGFASSPNFTTATVLVGTVAITTSPCAVNPTAPCYTVNGPTSITIGFIPPEPAGQVNILVSTPGGTSAATSQNVFSYDSSLPSVSELLPRNGATSGGEAISVFGNGFGQAGQDFVDHVFFGSTDVPSSNAYPCPSSPGGCFLVVGPTQLAIYTPANAAGSVDVRVVTPAGESGTGTGDLYTFVPPGAYTAISPYRACDTRPPGHGIVQNQCDIGANHTMGANGIVTAQITQPAGPVPTGAQAVVVNLTAIDHSSAITLITAYPAGTTRPVASNINLAGNTVESNLVIVQLSQAGGGVPAGEISLFNALGTADVIVDVEGYFASPSGGGGSGEFHSIPPLRRCDSRIGSTTNCPGSTNTPLQAGKWRDVVISGLPQGALAGTPSIPSTPGTASAAVFNLTGTNGTLNTLIAVAPALANNLCPTAQPAFSNLNPSAGIALPIRVISKLGPNQDVCLFSPAGSINFIIDVNGWFGSSTAPAGVLFYSIPPTRVCDTRPLSGYTCSLPAPGLTPKITDPIGIAGTIAVPADDQHSVQPVAIVANLTGIAGTANTVFILYPSDKARPSTSDLNPSARQVIANLAIVGLSTTTNNGDVSLYNAAGDINAVLDVAGWFQ